MFRTPREKPRLHVLVLDVVAGVHLTVGLPNFRQQPLLVGKIHFYGIGHEEIGASACSLGQLD